MNKSLSIRDLQKISAKALESLNEPVPVKSGDRTLGAYFPLKKTDPKKLKALLLRIERANKGRDIAADDAALEQYGPVDKTDWSFTGKKQRKKPAKKR